MNTNESDRARELAEWWAVWRFVVVPRVRRVK